MTTQSLSSLGAKTFTITTQPYYDSCSQCYKNILMVNLEPQGPLKQFVRRVKLNPLSSSYSRFRSSTSINPCNDGFPTCGLALGAIFADGCCNNNGQQLLTPNEVPDLLTYLLSHGYQLETQITNMMNQSSVKLTNRKWMFTVTYYGDGAEPNITYMR